MNGRILVTDDRPENRALARAILQTHDYEVAEAASGEEALQALGDKHRLPDAVLLDMRMGGLDGLEVLRRIRADPDRQLVPVILLTALDEHASKLAALASGADDYLTRPVDSAELLARVGNAIRIRRLAARVAQVQATLEALSVAVELRDQYTEDHTLRVTAYAAAICHGLGLDGGATAEIVHGASIHDVGKVAIPDAVLQKPAALTAAEYAQIQTHTVIGARICAAFGSESTIVRIVRHHHERVDGRGYPDGLVGAAIPLGARIVAVADAYDAMTSDRSYRPAMAGWEAKQELRRGAGSQWDPAVVTAFLGALEADQRLAAAARATGDGLRELVAGAV